MLSLLKRKRIVLRMKLKPIETEKEWTIIETILKELQEEVRKGTDEDEQE